MEIQIILNCNEQFQHRARYTFTMLGVIAGFRPRFSYTFDSIDEQPLIVYGNPIKNKNIKHVLIPEDQNRDTFFKGSLCKEPYHTKEIEFFDTRFLSVFHSIDNDLQSGSSDCIIIPSDIIADAFYFLSLFEEFVTVERDQLDRFEYKNSLLGKLNFHNRPVVAEYAIILQRSLQRFRKSVDDIPRYDGKKYAVCLTHDIDYLSKWSPGIAYQEIVKYFLLNQTKKSFSNRINRVQYFLKSVFEKNDPYKISFNKIIELEKKRDFTGTYFIKAGGNDKRDVTYNLQNKFLKKRIDELKSFGNEIGIHPSFNAYLNNDMLSREQNALSRISEQSIKTNRQHYLRLRYPDTMRILEQNNIAYDSTLGFAEMNGFRNGTCHPFLPYDLEKNRVMNFWEVPLHLMDGTLKDYRGFDGERSLDEIQNLRSIISAHNGVYTILFHNNIYDRYTFEGWNELFDNFLHSISHDDALVTTIPNTVTAWIKSLSFKSINEILSIINAD